ncbi:MAG: DUF1772 domain-containing protein [Actinomycetota bacterium]
MSFALLAAVHLAATGFMVGLMWTIHVVHYPLFALVNEPYRPFQEAHMARISRLLVVPWGVEVVSAAVLVLAAPSGSDRLLALVGLALVGAVLAITAFGAAPLHGRLVERFDDDLHHRLLQVDLVRTLLWTARLGPALALVVRSA